MMKNNVLKVATLSVLAVANGQFTGCNFNEILKVQRVSSAMMGCIGLSLSDMTGFASDLGTEDMAKITRCVEDPLRNQEDCIYIAQLMSELGASDSESVPAIVAESILSDPVGTCGCMSNVMDSPYREGIRESCTAGSDLNNALDSVERLCEVVIQNDPWATPKAIVGCSSTDAMRFNLLGLEYIECLNIDVDPDDVERLIAQIPDQTEALNTMMTCLRDPKTNNVECLEIINRISESVSRDNSLSAKFLNSLLVDPTTVCECAAGLGYSEIATQISNECSAKSMVDYLKAADESCAYLKVIEDKLDEKFEGCDTSDLVNTELVAVQTLGCLSLDSSNVVVSANELDTEKINQISKCLSDVATDNKACAAILDYFANSASDENTVASHVAEKLSSDTENFCRCIHNVAYSVPATSIADTCVADEWLNTVQASKSTCIELGKVDPADWEAVIKNNQKVKDIEVMLTNTADYVVEVVDYNKNKKSAFGLKPTN